ncbi:MAG TPA: hypothetical protein VFA33_24560 [Bryobacteraceae bacterium]|nr:hypothetical protein [Bryobacteraceae bacterium]
MPLTGTEEQHLIDYLLGQLTPEERASVEQRYFEDDEWFEQTRALEDELIRDYLCNALPAARRRLFEARYLAAPELRAKIEQTRTILEALRAERPAAPSPSVARPLWQRAADLFGLPPRLGFATAALSVASLAVAVWLGGQTATLRQNVARLERELASQARRAPVAASFLLSPGVLKGSEAAPKRLAIPPGVDQVRLELDIAGARKYERYRAYLRSVAGLEVASQEITPGGATDQLVFSLPSASLPADDYILSLGGLSSSGTFEELESYSFGIVRK